MAWNSITFGFGTVLTSAKMTNLYDNLTALANGDTGAPKVQPAAMANHAAATGNHASAWQYNFSTAAAYAKMCEIKTHRAGTLTVRLKIALYDDGVGGQGFARIYINGTAQGTARTTTSTTPADYDENFTVAAGDLIQVYGYVTDSPNDEIHCAMFFMDDAPYVPAINTDYFRMQTGNLATI